MTVCEPVSTNFLDLPGIEGKVSPPPPKKCASGSDPTSRLHWLIFDAMSVPIAAAPIPRRANITAMMNSGASDAKGASHCTRK